MTLFYRALLHLYPRGYRHEYGAEMTTTFEESLRGRSGLARIGAGTIGAMTDIIPNAVAVQLDTLRQDVRYAGRSLRRSPGFATTIILVVALGVGANTAAFSLADYVFTRPLPYPDADRIVRLWQSTPGQETSPANYRDWKTMSTSFASIGAFFGRGVNLVGNGEPARLESSRVTPEVMDAIGLPAIRGRYILPSDSADAQIVVISHRVWRSQFGADEGIIGKVVRLEGIPHVVIGVMPPAFRFPYPDIDLWTPLLLTENDFTNRENLYVETVARLRDGVTMEAAQTEFAGISARLEQAFPKENRASNGTVLGLRSQLGSRTRTLVLGLSVATLCVLLLACANIAGLLLVRATQRAREMAVRTALGARRDRIARQLMTENALLTVSGGALGIMIAVAGMPMLARLIPNWLPIGDQPQIDWRVLTIAGVFVAIMALTFGLVPVVGAGGKASFDALREGTRAGTRRTQRTRAVLVGIEVAASMVLLISSGVLIRAVLRIQDIDPGFATANVLTLRTALPFPEYDALDRREAFYARVLQGVRALPGVESAAYATGVPMVMRGGIWAAQTATDALQNRPPGGVSIRFVTTQYFGTMRIPIRAGRDFEESDRNGTLPVAIVSESFIDRHWPGESGIGKQFNIWPGPRTIVGVVRDVRVRGLEQTSEPQVYMPSAQFPTPGPVAFYAPKDLVVLSSGAATTLAPLIRETIRAADPNQPVSGIRMLDAILADQTAPRLSQVRVLGALAIVAMLIAGIGIHGLLSFSVSQRAREFAVRIALGASRRSVLASVMRGAGVIAAAGIIPGLLIGYFAARAMQAVLAGVAPGDMTTFAVSIGLCTATVLIGSLFPALRAMRVDPATAMRTD